MSNFDWEAWRQNLAATENLQSLKKWELEKHLQYFIKARSRSEVCWRAARRSPYGLAAMLS
jgi:hypothetical protein